MPQCEYEITVVDVGLRPFPPAKTLVKTGVPLAVAHRWAKVRREMAPSGLRKKLQAQRN